MKKIILLLLLFAGIANAQNLTFADISLKAMLVNGGDANFTAFSTNGSQVFRIDTNFDNQIQVSEAALIGRLWIEGLNAYAVTNIQGIEGFANLTELGFIGISTPTISLSGMPNLKVLSVNSPILTSATISGMPGLKNIGFNNNPLLTALTVANCANLEFIMAQGNAVLSNFTVNNLPTLENIYINDNQISSLNLTNCPNLEYINANNNNLTSINVSGLISLAGFAIEGNPNLTTINASGCSSINVPPSNFTNKANLQTLDFSNCSSQQMFIINDSSLSYLNVSGCTALTQLDLKNNALETLNLSGCTALLNLECTNNQLTSLDMSTCPSIQNLLLANNQIAALNLSGCANLSIVNLNNNQIPSLNLSGYNRLEYLSLEDNPTATLNFSGCAALVNVNLNNTQVVTADFSNCPVLLSLNFRSAVIASLNVQGSNALQSLSISSSEPQNAPITTLNLSGHANLRQLFCTYTNLTNVNIDGCTGLVDLFCAYGPIANLDFSDSPNIANLNLAYTRFTTIDVSNLLSLQTLSASGNNILKSVFAKNGASEMLFFNNQNVALEFVCQDDENVEDTQLRLLSMGLSNAVVNSYCSFTPGGNYNTITGTITFDSNTNGCDASDVKQPNMRIDINDGSADAATFTNANGKYTFYTGAGSFNLMPRLENPSLFSILPSPAIVPFSNSNNNVATQNFCITSVGNRVDTEIVIAPIWPAKPGFMAWYQIVIKNKGNQTANGSFNLTYNPSILHYAIATQAPNSQGTGIMSWNYSNLLPFENRSFYVGLNVNSPTQTPPANLGDLLTFTATINPIVADFNPADNQCIFNQEVVGSFDPNDITCLQGESVSPDTIGEYLHYIVNFENTGTAAAENIVVKVAIDETKYNINSLQLLNTSHQSRSIVRGNIAEFIFEDINLGAAGDPPVNGHGTILFKIKTLGTLVRGDMVEKTASIFFDYNAPIDTNLAETTFESLSNPDFSIDQSIVIYPNPAKDFVNIKCNNPIKSIELFDIQGRILQTLLLDTETARLDISSRANGIYFFKITTENGVKIEKLLKE